MNVVRAFATPEASTGGRKSSRISRLPGTATPTFDRLPIARIWPVDQRVSSSRPTRKGWVLDFDRTVPPRVDTLTGWMGNSDPLSQVRIEFPDAESAKAFATKQGWRFELLSSPCHRLSLQSYADKFKCEPSGALQGKLLVCALANGKHISTIPACDRRAYGPIES